MVMSRIFIELIVVIATNFWYWAEFFRVGFVLLLRGKFRCRIIEPNFLYRADYCCWYLIVFNITVAIKRANRFRDGGRPPQWLLPGEVFLYAYSLTATRLWAKYTRGAPP